nr:protein shisa-5 [Misgurnus anguillicaudatus]
MLSSSSTAFPLLFAALFAKTVAHSDCNFFTTNSGEFKHTVICNLTEIWYRLKGTFCCGTCDNRYCCTDPQKRLTDVQQNDCDFKVFKDLLEPPPETNDDGLVAIIVIVVGAIVFSVLFLICWVSPSCYLYKKCRNPSPVMEVTTVVTTQHLPQPTVIIGGRYPPYQPLTNDPENECPMGSYEGQPCVPGLPPPYQEADPGYPVHPPARSDFAHNPLHTDYTSPPPPPPINPAYVESTKN